VDVAEEAPSHGLRWPAPLSPLTPSAPPSLVSKYILTNTDYKFTSRFDVATFVNEMSFKG
jgi:hypothetical protein